MSPFKLLYEKKPFSKVSEETSDEDSFKRMENLIKLNIQRSYIIEATNMKAEENNNKKFKSCLVGTKVLLFDNKSFNAGSKLISNWSGPYIVTYTGLKTSWIAHSIQTPPNLVSNDRLKEYFEAK